jgi:hypothetical protein
VRSLDTTRFHGRSNTLGHPGATCALADVSPLIKDDEDIIGILAPSDSTQVSMTCQSVCYVPLPVRLVQSYANAYGGAAREMEHVRSNGRRTPLSFSRVQGQAKLGSDVISELVGDMFVMRCEKGFCPLPQLVSLMHDKHRLRMALTAANQRLSLSTA